MYPGRPASAVRRPLACRIIACPHSRTCFRPISQPFNALTLNSSKISHLNFRTVIPKTPITSRHRNSFPVSTFNPRKETNEQQQDETIKRSLTYEPTNNVRPSSKTLHHPPLRRRRATSPFRLDHPHYLDQREPAPASTPGCSTTTT